MEGYGWRSFVSVLGVLTALIWLAPNVVNFGDSWWFSKNKLNYGLDIQGGLHLVMGVDVDGVVKESTTRLASSLDAELKKEAIPYAAVAATNPSAGEIEITTAAPDDRAKIEKHLGDRYATMLQVVDSEGTSIKVKFYEAYLLDYRAKVIQQAIETLRNRVDEFGVSEPSISQQGPDRILVQLPGMADAERAKELINTTARLDFMIVSDEKTPDELNKLITEAEQAGKYDLKTLKYSEYVTRLNEDLKTKLPEGTVLYFEKAENAATMEVGRTPFLLKKDTNLGGGDLDDAFITFGRFQEPEVALRFNGMGASKFSDITGANVNKRMAIVLDKIIKSAPNIKDRITGGQAVIQLGANTRDRNASLNEAKLISTSLRAGALPASLEQLEERRVGPTLGADAIDRAKFASYLGAFVIVLFMLVYYKAMGAVTAVSLGLNILSIFAFLTSFGATLTLPGIAGIALTVGFAVDANVLINERIREELARGANFKVAIKEGYARAMSAILDANITTACTAVVLLYFGTGPVKGFAVTLLIGIGTTLFCNVFISKVIVDTLIYKFGVKRIAV